MSTALCPAAAIALDRAGWPSVAKQIRDWHPVGLRSEHAERRRMLDGFLFYLSGILEAQQRNGAEEAEITALQEAFDAVERELDAIDRRATG